MERRRLANGRFPNHNHRGSIFILAIVTLAMFTFFYLSLAENYQLSVYMTNRNTQYYKMKLMKELFLSEYLAIPEEERPNQGVYHYTSGEVSFTKNETVLKIISKTNRHHQMYQEIIETTIESTEESTQILEESSTDK